MQKNFKDGVHDISNDSYHGSDGVSRSGLWLLKRAPAYYYDRYINPYYVDHKTNKSLVMGSLVHCLTLEPELFNEDYIVKPELSALPKPCLLKDVGREEFDARKKVRVLAEERNKVIMADFKTKAEDRMVITQAVFDEAKNMAHSILSDDFSKSLIKGAKIEQSIYWTHEGTGIQCKARPDAWFGSVIVDVKTTEDASYRDFQRSAYSYGYFLQAGMISEALRSVGIAMEKFIILAVEKKQPYATATFVLDEDSIQYGIDLFDKLMHDFKQCQDDNRWPAYQLETLSLPGYANFEEL